MGKTFCPSITSAPASSNVIFAGLVKPSALWSAGSQPSTAAEKTIAKYIRREIMLPVVPGCSVALSYPHTVALIESGDANQYQSQTPRGHTGGVAAALGWSVLRWRPLDFPPPQVPRVV